MENEMPRAGISYEDAAEKYIDTVYRLALSRTNSKEHAEDVVQEVFLRLLQKKERFESYEHLKAWLLRVTINCSRKIFSSAWFRKTVPLDEEISFETPERSDVYFAVNELPQKYRTVIYLYYYEEMSVKEISSLLRLSEGTIKSQLYRGRELLRDKLEGGDIDV